MKEWTLRLFLLALVMALTACVPLTVNKAGSGTVTSSPSGINCGAVCKGNFNLGAQVTLTAAPGSGHTFSSWADCDQPSGNSCVETMNQPKTVTAKFVTWTGMKQLGTTSSDVGRGVAVDGSGNVYVTGYTWGGLDGNTNVGGEDIFLVKYNSAGMKQWTKQLGTTSLDEATGVAVDSSGNVYVTGYTRGGLDGNTSAGEWDIFLVKYNSAGTKQWTKQLGTAVSDWGSGVAVDGSGNVYVAGSTWGGLDGNTSAGWDDIFLVKYNPAGTKQWTKQLGTTNPNEGNGVAVDSSGNVYVTGWTGGGLDGNTNAGGEDIFLVKYNSAGTKQWTKQLGTAFGDRGNGVAVDGIGNVYVTGYTYGGLDGNINAGEEDIFLVKYNSAGTKQWTKQLGTTSYDVGRGVAVDSSGNVYVTGSTSGGLDGNTNVGSDDIFLVKYNSNGVKQ